MKNHFKYSILISLALMMAISAVFAQSTPSNIGKTGQPVPWDSNPTAHAVTTLAGVTDPAKMYDGILAQFGSFTGGSGL